MVVCGLSGQLIACPPPEFEPQVQIPKSITSPHLKYLLCLSIHAQQQRRTKMAVSMIAVYVAIVRLNSMTWLFRYVSKQLCTHEAPPYWRVQLPHLRNFPRPIGIPIGRAVNKTSKRQWPFRAT